VDELDSEVGGAELRTSRPAVATQHRRDEACASVGPRPAGGRGRAGDAPLIRGGGILESFPRGPARGSPHVARSRFTRSTYVRPGSPKGSFAVSACKPVGFFLDAVVRDRYGTRADTAGRRAARMQSKSMISRGFLIALAIAAIVLATAGCGSSNKGPAAATATFGGGLGAPATRQVIYQIPLRGPKGPPGASQASGVALLTAEPRSGRLCWSFTQLRNVVPNGIWVFKPGPEEPGFSLGHGYEAAGCASLQPIFLEVLSERGFWIGLRSGRSREIALSGPIEQATG
jgi:hypothetical protein